MNPGQVEIFTHDVDYKSREGFQEIISQWIEAVISKEVGRGYNIRIILCSDEYLLSLNQKYLQHDYFTDVLTFPYSEDPLEGEIYISIDRIAENAGDRSITNEEELCRVIIHGVLHLVGYDDLSEADRENMTVKENQYLSLLKAIMA